MKRIFEFKNYSWILSLAFFFMLNVSCSRESFLKLKFSGILTDENGVPLKVVLTVKVQDATKPKNNGRKIIWESGTTPAGFFDVNTLAGRQPFYYLYVRLKGKDLNLNVSTGKLDENTDFSIYVPDATPTDIGTIRTHL